MTARLVRAAAAVGVVGAVLLAGGNLPSGVTAREAAEMVQAPQFTVDPGWPVLPNGWVMGDPSSIAVDRHDHVWVLHRPRTIPAEKKDKAAPPVLEFDQAGRFVQGWGGASSGYEWPDTEHGIYVDHKDRVWIGGNNGTPIVQVKVSPHSDDMLLVFSTKGKFIRQIGRRNGSTGNDDTGNLKQPADVFVSRKTGEAFVADGYGNRRVAVFDADSGKFKRMWGAFGNKPVDGPLQPPPNAPPEGPQQFAIVHAVRVSDDGFVYVADRPNRRVQVFTLAGKYVTQVILNQQAGGNTTCGLAFSPDQRYLYVSDFSNARIAVIERASMKVLYQFGSSGKEPGQFRNTHHIAVDSKGNLFTAEVNPGSRVQRFRFTGLASVALGSGAPPPATARPAPPAALQSSAAAGGAAPGAAALGNTAPSALPPPGPYQGSGVQGSARVDPGRSLLHNPYTMVENWPTLNPGMKWGAAINFIPDNEGGTWMLFRSEPPIVKLSAEGKITASLGAGVLTTPHGLCRDSDGNFWAGDNPFSDNPATRGKGFQVFKFSPDGTILLTLGQAGVARATDSTFVGPTSCVQLPGGDILIADGHWPRPASAQQDGDRLVRYTKDGKFVRAYGKLGSGPGEFMGPHALALDSQGRIFVADRSNSRIQIFDKDMNYLDAWRHFGRPSGVAILKDDTLVVADSESGIALPGPKESAEGQANNYRNVGWRQGIRIGSAKDGSLRSFIENTNPEGMGADELGNVYAGLTTGCAVSKSGGCVQKFVPKK